MLNCASPVPSKNEVVSFYLLYFPYSHITLLVSFKKKSDNITFKQSFGKDKPYCFYLIFHKIEVKSHYTREIWDLWWLGFYCYNCNWSSWDAREQVLKLRLKLIFFHCYLQTELRTMFSNYLPLVAILNKHKIFETVDQAPHIS